MRRRAFVFALLALAACRGVIGIEDLKLGDAGPTGDGGGDVVAPPGTPPGMPPAPPPGPLMGDAGTCGAQTGGACVMCCRGMVPMDQNGAFDTATKACACMPGNCGATYCPMFCAGTGSPTSDPQCPPMCLDPTVFDAGCSALRDCYDGKTPNCKELATCVAGCRP